MQLFNLHTTDIIRQWKFYQNKKLEFVSDWLFGQEKHN